MEERTKSTDHLANECRTIAENCLYTAQAHYAAAGKAGLRFKLVVFIPSCICAIVGFLVALGLPAELAGIAAVMGLIAATASFLGIQESESAHKQAANLMTCLRHEARSLCETYCHDYTQEQFHAEVRRLNDKYNSLVQLTEVTDPKSFEEGREKIKKGLFAPPFTECR